MCAALTHWFTSIQVRTKIEIRHSERMSNLTIRTKSTARTHTVRVFACQQTDLYSQNQVGSNCHFSIEIQAKTEFWPSIINQIRNFTNTTRQFCKSWNNSKFKVDCFQFLNIDVSKMSNNLESFVQFCSSAFPKFWTFPFLKFQFWNCAILSLLTTKTEQTTNCKFWNLKFGN